MWAVALRPVSYRRRITFTVVRNPARGGFAHHGDDGGERVEQAALTGAGDMGKEPPFNRIVLRTITRVVRHPNFHANLVGQQLQIMLEDIGVRGVAAATIAQPQDRGRLRITLLANAVPIPAKAVARKLAGVVGQAEVNMPAVADPIVNAVRNQHPLGPAGKIMIERVKRLATAAAPGPKQLAEVLFRFRVN